MGFGVVFVGGVYMFVIGDCGFGFGIFLVR